LVFLQVSGEEWSECARGGNAVKAVRGDALLFFRCLFWLRLFWLRLRDGAACPLMQAAAQQ
jgi:hypothetical protein